MSKEICLCGHDKSEHYFDSMLCRHSATCGCDGYLGVPQNHITPKLSDEEIQWYAKRNKDNQGDKQ